jgi:predicted O-methyltransferase YrrM
MGLIQDDEALFLFGLIRVVRIKRILEIGGLNGYSALNFLKALEHSPRLYNAYM